MHFVDRFDIHVKAGDGGSGCLSFRREKYVPRGGPDGGDGGHGGSVIIRAVPGTDSLAGLVSRRHWKAPKGVAGMGKNRTGANGDDLVLAVPPGTIIRDRDHQFVLKDLNEPFDQVVVARGGKGGKGNTRFATSTNQTPRQFEPGTPGEERWLTLELKIIADVGLIGLPNAGKSTLLSRLSHAHPEIADYPFTTKYPNIGICKLGPERTCVLADIPGLIEGAHEGHGLGHEFLRHVERTRILVHLVECMPPDGTSPLEHYRTIRHELESYSAKLVDKPELVAISKAELGDTSDLKKQLENETGHDVLVLSSVTGQGLKELTHYLSKQLLEMRPPEPEPEPQTPPHRRPELDQAVADDASNS